MLQKIITSVDLPDVLKMIYDNLDQLYEEIKNDRSQLIEIKD